MSNARAYMMVYRLSVVSEFRVVLVLDCVRGGGQGDIQECNVLGESKA